MSTKEKRSVWALGGVYQVTVGTVEEGDTQGNRNRNGKIKANMGEKQQTMPLVGKTRGQGREHPLKKSPRGGQDEVGQSDGNGNTRPGGKKKSFQKRKTGGTGRGHSAVMVNQKKEGSARPKHRWWWGKRKGKTGAWRKNGDK